MDSQRTATFSLWKARCFESEASTDLIGAFIGPSAFITRSDRALPLSGQSTLDSFQKTIMHPCERGSYEVTYKVIQAMFSSDGQPARTSNKPVVVENLDKHAKKLVVPFTDNPVKCMKMYKMIHRAFSVLPLYDEKKNLVGEGLSWFKGSLEKMPFPIQYTDRHTVATVSCYGIELSVTGSSRGDVTTKLFRAFFKVLNDDIHVAYGFIRRVLEDRVKPEEEVKEVSP